MRLFHVLEESFGLAANELLHNRLRAFLSLLGITIGIFCIIAVFGAVDSLEGDIRGSMKDLGDDAVYVTKWPWKFGGDYPWWEYMKRPESNYSDFKAITNWADKASAIAIVFDLEGKTVKHGDNVVEGSSVMGASYDYNKVYALNLVQGRYFSMKESQSGAPVAIVGADLAEGLSAGGVRLLGTDITVMGQRLSVIGILEKEGTSVIDFGFDERVIVPYRFLAGLVNVNSPYLEQSIVVAAKPGVSLGELKSELRGIMRVHRKLRPKQEDNFALNEMSAFSEGLDVMFGAIRFAGGFIGIFSILVGGFGIANIMFVSVKERTGMIGIKKALGAKNGFILSEFLIEAVILCVIGGILGLIGVWLLMQLVNTSPDIGLTFVLSAKNIVTGLAISAVIGLIAGLAPAIWASRMDPVVAMRS